MANKPADVARAWRAHQRDMEDEPGFRVGIAGSFTCEPIESAFGLALVEAGISRPDLAFADYNQLHQLCLDPAGLFDGAVDHIVAFWRIEDVWPAAADRFIAGDDASLGGIVDGVTELASLFARLADGPTPVSCSTPPLPLPWGMDPFDSRTSVRCLALHQHCLDAWNRATGASNLSTIDLAVILTTFGTQAAHDSTKWALYHQPYTSTFWALLGELVAHVVLRQTRPTPKCLALDCDNTLWGGVIGEDGLAGIDLADTFPGSAFRTFQLRLKQLKEAGVLLTLVSKNDESAVREVFDRHDAMVLTPDDIAVWKVNWLPKSSNIAEIATELNIGIDSIVFVDDSSFELAEVTTAQPLVTCIQIPEEPAEIPDVLGQSGLFRHMKVSAEDRERTVMMLAERDREQQTASLSPAEFLDSLQLHVHFFAPGEEHIGRVAQLTNKTNQFNLTTVRRSEAEIRALVEDDSHEVRAIRVNDRFGDYGVVGVAVAEVTSDTWTIDSLLMSCRVLGRGVEDAFLRALVDDAAAAGASRLAGRYVPSPKNGQVADFYSDRGFSGDSDRYAIDLSRADPGPAHITTTR